MGAVAVVAVLAVGSSAAAQTPEVDAFGTDRNSLSGTIDEICGPGPTHDAAASRPGRIALIGHLDQAFPDVQGFAGFSCREIHNRRSACAGREAPASSDCWSTHAAGRAIDIMVGGAGNQEGRPVGGELGDGIVNHLLERVNGVDNYRARIMGIQQLLWNGTCWSSRTHAGDGITDVSQLDDDCVDDHDNHVHVTLSEAGAEGLTSFHTDEVLDPALLEARVIEPVVYRDQHMVLYDATTGRLQVRGLDEDGAFTDVEGTDRLAKGWTTIATPDVAGNGDQEVFAYRSDNGRHVLRELRADGSLGSTIDRGRDLDAGYTIVASPDVDGDGDDELLLYRAEDGAWVLHELLSDGALGPALQAGDAVVDVFFSAAATPDLDGDGDDELVLYRRFDGSHVVMDFRSAEEADDDDVDAADAAPEADDVADAGDTLDALDGSLLDTDDDGVIDVQVVLESRDGTPRDPADGPDAQLDEDAAPPVGALDVALSAGFTTLAAPDIDHDGIDELVFYRAGDGCLAIRRLGGAGALDMADGDDQVDEADAVSACLVAPEGDAGVSESTDLDDVPAVRWMVESWDTVDAGWTAGGAAAIGPERGPGAS